MNYFGGKVIVGDTSHGLIKAVTPAGVVTTIAGSGAGSPFSGGAYSDGAGTAAGFSSGVFASSRFFMMASSASWMLFAPALIPCARIRPDWFCVVGAYGIGLNG